MNKILLELTLQCNMRCEICGSKAGHKKADEMSTEKFLSLISEISRTNVSEIQFIGGEIFLHPDWQLIIRSTVRKGIRYSLISNGTFFELPGVIDFLKANPPLAIGISLDGDTADLQNSMRVHHNGFALIMQGIEALSAAGLPYSFITTVLKPNITRVVDILNMIKTKNPRGWQIQIANDVGRFDPSKLISVEEYYLLGMFIARQRELQTTEFPIYAADDIGYYSRFIPIRNNSDTWQGCQAGQQIIGIQSDGCVRGCLSVYDQSLNEKVNLKQRSLTAIWDDPEAFAYNDLQGNDLQGFCRNCEFAKLCRAGCKGTAMSSTGSLGENLFCFHRIEETWQPSDKYSDGFNYIFSAVTDKDIEPNINSLYEEMNKRLKEVELSENEKLLFRLLD